MFSCNLYASQKANGLGGGPGSEMSEFPRSDLPDHRIVFFPDDGVDLVRKVAAGEERRVVGPTGRQHASGFVYRGLHGIGETGP